MLTQQTTCKIAVMSTRKLSEYDTGLTADTVEWCPAVHLESIAACGAYQLDSSTGRRRGSLSLHKLTNPQNTGDIQGHTSARVLQDRVLNYGILDMKWAVCSDRTLLALAASSGDVVFMALAPQAVPTCEQKDEGGYVLEEVGKVAVSSRNEKPGLCLSLDWNRDSQGHLIATSDSLGMVSVVDCEVGSSQGQGKFRVAQSWRAHEFEAWIVCFGRQSHCVFSGGDDCRLRMWDTRTMAGMPALTSKEHTMGVCSLQLHPLHDHLLASGSYDERILVWDVRAMQRPVKETAVGGGVWRIKWHPANSDLMATACMYDGFRIHNWHLDNDTNAVETVCDYRQHGSLAYGIDWSRSHLADPTHLLASCSFYDHSLHFWTANL